MTFVSILVNNAGAIVTAVIGIILVVVVRNRFKRVKIGPSGVELDAQTGEVVDPETECPYRRTRQLTRDRLDKIDSSLDGITERLQEVSQDTNKLLFYNKDLPEEERLIAGLRYKNRGGNSEVSRDVLSFARDHRHEYRAIIRLKPQFALPELGEG